MVMGGVGLIIPAGLMVPGLHERSDHRELLVVQTERSTPNARPGSTAVYVPKPLERIVIPPYGLRDAVPVPPMGLC